MRGSQRPSRGRGGKWTNGGNLALQPQSRRSSKNLPNAGHRRAEDRNPPRRVSKRLQNQHKSNLGSRREGYWDHDAEFARGRTTHKPLNKHDIANTQHKRRKLRRASDGDLIIPDAIPLSSRSPNVPSPRFPHPAHHDTGFAAYLRNIHRIPSRRESQINNFTSRTYGLESQNVFRESLQRRPYSFQPHSSTGSPDPELLADAGNAQIIPQGPKTTEIELTDHPSPEPSTPTTIKFRRILLWWVRALNTWCVPILDEELLLQQCNSALENSDIPPNVGSLNALLELAYDQIYRSKRLCDPENRTIDTLSFEKLRLAKQLESNFGVSFQPSLDTVREATPPATPTESTIMTSALLLSRQFFDLLNGAINAQNGENLKTLLPIEPPFQPDYHKLLDEVFARFTDVDVLKEAIRTSITAASIDDKDAWQAFPEFLATWFQFVKTVNPENLLETYEKLSNLLK
jgi:hypothetical protein